MKTKISIIALILTAGMSYGNIVYVPIPAKSFTSSNETVNVAAFEIMEHPVTNSEYLLFVKAAGYPCPLHWKNGTIPAGKEEHPVIFVNRDDAEAYALWLTNTTGRIHRIPASLEFLSAAMGRETKRYRYYWGSEKPSELGKDKINYDQTGDRKFNRREDHLKPARWGMKNSAGLYQMAGNVWHLVNQWEDPATTTYKYRIYKPSDIERSITGGSWAGTEEYLYCGLMFAQAPGLRYPDLGFRLVRQPEDAVWKEVNRQVCLATSAAEKVIISWALLNDDKPGVKFNVYRITGKHRAHNGTKINKSPVASTSFLDENVTKGVRYQYRVVPVDKAGKELNPSEWSGITAGETAYPVVAKFKPVQKVDGELTPVFGNLEGNGKPGCVIRIENGNREASQDPGYPVQMEAFAHTGRSLWRKDIASHSNILGNWHNAPFCVWDMNNDGKDEVITLLQIGTENHVAILDGMSGDVMYKTPWTKLATDHARSSSRLLLSIAYLDGKTPAVITQTGVYENEIITAYDAKLNKLWEYNSFMETSGSGSHKIEVSDVDGDGRQEIIYGSVCLNHDGTLRWCTYKQHPDIVSIFDHIPGRPGLEVCFIVETTAHAGIYMTDAGTGEIIWKNNRRDDPKWNHGHWGWTADIWDGAPGMECITNRAGHNDHNYLVFSGDGKFIADSFPRGYTPVEWDGDDTRDLIGDNGHILGKYNGKEVVKIDGPQPNPIPDSKLLYTADLCGDFRGEPVILATGADKRKTVMLLTAPIAIDRMFISPRESLDYRLWLARNMGGGYGSIFDYKLKTKK
jgi:rhamnogalacturonan endolyase